jgi:hypothetical protein
MTRAISALLILALSGCGFEVEKRGYVIRSVSVDAAPGMISATLTLDNRYWPEAGNSCIGVEVCNETVE